MSSAVADYLLMEASGAVPLRPVRSGRGYRIASPAELGIVKIELAAELETIFERVAHVCGLKPDRPLEIRLGRGVPASSPGHGEGRAADITDVGYRSLRAWKLHWDRVMAAARAEPEERGRADAVAAEGRTNLGYGLYKALQEHGGWRVDPTGWGPYRGVIQLFRPWTASEGPWQAMRIRKPNPYQRRRLADQRWVFLAHRDHIHVAK
jgi:hypothetical protein